MEGKVINFIGGPGAGKTTFAALLFAKNKSTGKSTEFVSEYIKQLIYIGDTEKINDQEYVSGYQKKLLEGAVKQIQYVVTDAPLLHGIVYNKFHHKNDEKHLKLNTKILEWTKSFKNIFIFVERNKELDYKEKEGRIHTAKDAIEIDKLILKELQDFGVKYLRVSPSGDNTEQLEKIIKYIDEH